MAVQTAWEVRGKQLCLLWLWFGALYFFGAGEERARLFCGGDIVHSSISMLCVICKMGDRPNCLQHSPLGKIKALHSNVQLHFRGKKINILSLLLFNVEEEHTAYFPFLCVVKHTMNRQRYLDGSWRGWEIAREIERSREIKQRERKHSWDCFLHCQCQGHGILTEKKEMHFKVMD